MNVKALVPLVAGLGIGGVALVMGINTLKSARAAQKPVPMAKLWGAKDAIPRGREIQPEMLKEIPFPAKSLPAGAFTEKEKLVGRVLRIVAPGELPVLESMLTPPGTRPGIFVKTGYRAVAIKIDSGSGVDYHLEPGRFVDVVASFKVRRQGRRETIARTIVENAELAAVGPRLSPETGDEESGTPRGRSVRAVTLFVQPDQVKQLLLAEQMGRIKLSLRGEEDVAALDDSTWVSDLELTGELDQELETDEPETEIPVPTGALAMLSAPTEPAGPDLSWSVSVYRGRREETIQFKDRESSERVGRSGGAPDPIAPGHPLAGGLPPGMPLGLMGGMPGQYPDEYAEYLNSQQQQQQLAAGFGNALGGAAPAGMMGPTGVDLGGGAWSQDWTAQLSQVARDKMGDLFALWQKTMTGKSGQRVAQGSTPPVDRDAAYQADNDNDTEPEEPQE